ncbi:MAG: cytochrome b/b6 domain-containing protein [Pseudomonadota bacterium]
MAAMEQAAVPMAGSRRVVDAPTRVLHGVLAVSFIGAWLSAEAEGWRTLHVTLGYTAGAAVLLRLLWGVWGPRHARLLPRLRPAWGLPVQLLEAARVALGRARPAGGASPASGPAGAAGASGLRLLGALHAATVAALLGATLLTVASGWLNLQGVSGEAAEELHEVLGNGMLALVGLHLAGLIAHSVRAGHNRLLAMLTGRLPGRGPDLVRRNHAGIALVLLAGVAAFGGWRWVQAPDPMVLAYEQQHEHHRGADPAAAPDEED